MSWTAASLLVCAVALLIDAYYTRRWLKSSQQNLAIAMQHLAELREEIARRRSS